MPIKTVWDILFYDVTALRLPVGGASERVASRSTVGRLRLFTLLHGRPVNCTKREALRVFFFVFVLKYTVIQSSLAEFIDPLRKC